MNLKSSPNSRNHRLLIGIISLALLGGLGCSLFSVLETQATLTPAPTQVLPTLPAAPVDSLPPTLTGVPPAPAGETVDFRGVSFSYDASLAGFVNAEVVEAVPQDDNPYWAVSPEHLEFTFVDYVLPDAFHEPLIYIFPAPEFEAMNESARDAMAGMRTLLAEKPADPRDPIPFVPVFNAAQFFAAAVNYVDFQNGAGVRFVSMYGQAAWPVNSQDLFYAYQGMTADGAHYVSAVLPISHPSLPATGDEVMEGMDFEDFADTFEAHLAEVEATLNVADPASFYPSLGALDALVRSISVQGW